MASVGTVANGVEVPACTFHSYSLELELESTAELLTVFESLINCNVMFTEFICILICLFQKMIVDFFGTTWIVVYFFGTAA